MRSRRVDLREQVERDVVLHQDVAAVLGELRVLDLQPLEAEGAPLLRDGLPHRRRAELDALRAAECVDHRGSR